MIPRESREMRHLPLFRDMLKANFDALIQSTRCETVPPGHEVIRQGDPADALHVVVDGAIELYAHWEGRETTMAVVRPVGTFILAACIRDAPYLMSARSLEPARIICIPASDLRAVFRRDPEFAVSVIHELAGCYRAVVRDTKGLKLRTTRERVAAYLLRQSRDAGDVEAFALPVEKKMLASFLGMTPESLSRGLRSLEVDGVKIDGMHVKIVDRARLSVVARLDPLIDGPDPDGSTAGVSLPAAGIRD